MEITLDRIALLIPCYNEEPTITKVIDDFARELPGASIYVFDNNSSDKTAELALNKGATVIKEMLQGKGNVVRSMFRNIDADIYIMVDGDDTYPAHHVKDLINPLLKGEADMVVADRLSNKSYRIATTRPYHNFGNELVKRLINWLFDSELKDIMSGYRAFTRYFIKNTPILSKGFEIETEITLHALDKHFHIREVPIEYRERPEGSHSKLNTFVDGYKVIRTILWIFKDYKPMYFFSLFSILLFLSGLTAGLLPVIEFLKFHFIYRIPLVVLATGLMIFSSIFFTIGLILDTVSKFQKFNYELNLYKYNYNKIEKINHSEK